jgi:hypothetical protein
MPRFAKVGLVIAVLLATVFVVAFAQSQYFYTIYVRTAAYVTGKAVVTDSLRSQGPFKLNGKFTATTAVRGSATFETGAAIDTVAVSGVTTNSIVFVTQKFAAADTAARVQLAAAPGTDTIFVYQASVGGYKSVDYNWLVIH